MQPHVLHTLKEKKDVTVNCKILFCH